MPADKGRSRPGNGRKPSRGLKAVVVGGSAGGLESLKAMLRPLPADFPAPILVVLHLDPKRPSLAAALLEGHTALRVRQAAGGERPARGTVYLAPPDRHLEVRGGRLELTQAARVNFSRPSVDRLFASAAEAYGDGALAVILSGTGLDGREGVRQVKQAGGACIVEDPRQASHPGMPQAAADTGCTDAALPAAELGARLAKGVRVTRAKVTAADWRAAAAILKRQCGIDFQGYRPETLRRRMQARVAATGSPSAARYVATLRRDPAELERLRSALLVKVSSFLRDPPLWSLLERLCLPALARRKAPGGIRMWSAGCATGEEAYTLAMLTLAAARRPVRLKVFATDLDEPALAQARTGCYPSEAVKAIPPALARRFFQADGGQRRVGAELRRHVIFGRHDVVRDPPLAGMDLVACRNVLIYLKPPERREALARLASALRPGGILFLGAAEGTVLPGPGFARVARGAPIFRRTGAAGTSGRRTSEDLPTSGRTAAAFFGIPSLQAVGNPLASLVPGAALERAARAALRGGRKGRVPKAKVAHPDGGATLAVETVRLPGRAGLLFVGEATGAAAALAARAGPGDEASGAEAASPMAAQQALNEELQSRNEELETVNEELQSLNDEIQVQGDEARRATLFLTALLDAGPDVVVGCDRRGRVSYWGAPAVRLFRLSAPQALGKDLLQLVPRLDVAPLRRRLRGGAGRSRAARAPRTIQVGDGLRVTVWPASDGDGKVHGNLLRIVAAKPRPPGRLSGRAARPAAPRRRSGAGRAPR